MSPSLTQVDPVTFSCLDVSGCEAQEPIREVPESPNSRNLVADLRYVCISRISMRLAAAIELGGCTGVKHGVGSGRCILRTDTDPRASS